MRLKELMSVLFTVFIIVAGDNGLFDGNKDLNKSQIQRDQNGNAGNQSEEAGSNNAALWSSAYPSYSNQNHD